jgi:Ca-activated chloride channel family protein
LKKLKKESMRHFKYTLFLCSALLCWAVDLRPQTPSASSPVKVYFTARDQDKNLVPTFNKDNIQLLEDGISQRITALDNPAEVQVNLSLLIDVSPSQEQNIATVRVAATSLVNSTLSPGKDTSLLAIFTEEVKVQQRETGNLQLIQSAIQSFKFEPPLRDSHGHLVVVDSQGRRATRTALWDSVWIFCEYILPQSDKRARQVIVVFTDGDDNSSQKTRQDAVARAVRSNALVYVIRIGTEEGFRVVDRTEANAELNNRLAEITKATGGRLYWMYSTKDEKGLASAIDQIASEVRNQYRISYTPTRDARKGQYRKLEIKQVPAKKGGIKADISHQKGYYVDAS